jgi:thiamine pyrophosphokinase
VGLQKILGILAGTDIPLETVVAWANSADIVVAADGAANQLLKAGFHPHVIVGDMDSLDSVVQRSNLAIHEDLDQETTDCDKLLNFVRRTYPGAQFSLTGLEGDRFDHVLASLHSVGRLFPEARIVLRDGLAWFVQPKLPQTVPTLVSQTVSLIPILPCEGVLMKGVQWAPNTSLSPMGFTSISNLASSTQVEVSIESGLGLLILQVDTKSPTW